MAVRRSHRRLVALVLSTFLCGGCAARAHGTWADRFVKPGKSGVDLGGPAAKSTKAHRHANPDANKPNESFGVSRPAMAGASVESFDQRLSAALLIEKALPSAENHLRVAEEYRRLGILDASASHLDQALTVAPRFAPAHEELARIWRDWGFPERGLGAAYRATFYAPQAASAQNTLGTLLAALGQPEDARRAYERALALNPAAAWVLNNLCDLERRAGQLHASEERCRAALAIDPNLAAAHNNLAMTLAASGDVAGARGEFLATGDPAGANYNIGLMYMTGGDYVSAANAFEAAIQLRPSFTAAKKRAHVMRLYLLTGGK
jgi:tetratricopeptide (TPR) repeat protein